MRYRPRLGRLTTRAVGSAMILLLASGCGAQPRAERSARSAGASGTQSCPSSLPGTGTVPPQPNLRFVSTRRGYVSGPSGVFTTADGGASWQRSYAGAAGDMDFVGRLSGWAITPTGLVATTDGGRCWRALPPPPEPLSSVDFVDTSVGWAITAAEDGRSTSVLTTDDGGAHWHPVAAPAHPRSVCFSNRADGYLGATGSVFSTADGGRIWSRVLDAPPIGAPQSAQVYCSGRRGAWVIFTGSAVAAGSVPYIVYRSADAKRWTPVFEQTQFRYPPAREGPGAYPGPLSVIDAEAAAFIGINPSVGSGQAVPVIATDGGTELAQGHPVPTLATAVSVSFASTSHGWVVGPVPTGGWAVYVTVDGGTTWVPQLHIRPP